MASTRGRVKVKVKKKPGKLRKLFSLEKTKSQKNFTSSFQYGNLAISITSKAGIVKCDVKLDGKNVGFSGVITLNEKSFSELHYMINQLFSTVRNIKS